MVTTILNLSSLFVYMPAGDEQADDGFALTTDTSISIQHAPYVGRRAWFVNQMLYDTDGQPYELVVHGGFRSLAGAQVKAVSLAQSVLS